MKEAAVRCLCVSLPGHFSSLVEGRFNLYCCKCILSFISSHYCSISSMLNNSWQTSSWCDKFIFSEASLKLNAAFVLLHYSCVGSSRTSREKGFLFRSGGICFFGRGEFGRWSTILWRLSGNNVGDSSCFMRTNSQRREVSAHKMQAALVEKKEESVPLHCFDSGDEAVSQQLF